MTNTLTQARLREVLHYEPETGLFTWIKKTCNRVIIGAVAGALRHDGYIVISIDGQRHVAHRLAHLYMTGEFPENLIDHAKGNKADNRWSKLRPATQSQNAMNGGPPINNTSGVRGVSWERRRKRWHAYITKDYKMIHLGHFDTLEEAATRRRLAAEHLFGEFAREAA